MPKTPKSSDDPRDEAPSTKPKRCAVCQIERPTHDQMLADGEIHHRFSESGELIHESQRRPQVRASSDLALRMALIDAGVVTYEDIARAELRLREVPAAQGRGPRDDAADRTGT